jgi:hypothetical protein
MRKVVEFFEHYPQLYAVLRAVSGVRDTSSTAPGAAAPR